MAKKLVGPLSVAQAPDGTRYWTDSFAGLLYKQAPGGARPSSTRARTTARRRLGRRRRAPLRDRLQQQQGRQGLDPRRQRRPAAVGDTYAYEKTANPDGKFNYGFLKTPKSCLAQLPKNIPGSYSGVKETHPYATATANGITYVADAGANAILAISPTGVFSTVAALKPVKVKVTRPAAEANKLPNCTVGKKFALEAVPTDIEYGPDGQLYVTSLPGGPEDGSLGLNGRVLKIDPTTGKVSTLVGGLLSPTGSRSPATATSTWPSCSAA